MLVRTTITWIFSNFGLFMLLLAVVCTLLNHLMCKKSTLAELFYRWLAFLPLGFTALYAFIMHAFFPDFTAQTIGWQNSPFQFEVAMANLALGTIALVSIYRSFDFRLAVVIANACWLWGDAVGHGYQIFVYDNLTLGNAGSWFYMDMLMPLLLIITLMRLKKPTI